MAISRAQMEEQIRGFATGGILDPASFLQEPEPDPFAYTPLPQNVQDDIDRDFENLLQEQAARALMTPATKTEEPSIEVPKFEERFPLYQDRLSKLMGQRDRPSFYDLASTVGGAMLSADPTAGAFRSMGAGLAQFGKEERERRRKEREEDRAIALKAFELAQKDESAARNLLNEYELYKAKQVPDNAIKFYKVASPGGIRLHGKVYQNGEEIPLTENEAMSYRAMIGPAGSSGVKTTGAGMFATFMSQADAENAIEQLGLSRDAPSFATAVASITAKTPEQVGKYIPVGSTYGELTPLIKDDEVINIMITPSKSAGTPLFQTYAGDRLKQISKAQTQFNDNAVTVLPTVEQGLNLLLDPNVQTGAFDAVANQFKRIATDAFGTVDAGVTAIDSLEAIANRLGPKMRPVGSGSTSDMEFKAYKQALLSISNQKLANYLSLYAFKKMTENAIELNNVEKRLLTSGQYSDSESIETELRKLDRGIWEKYDGTSTDDSAIQGWYDSLPDGAVILNRGSDGMPLIVDEAGSSVGPYVVKGWRG